MKALAAEMTKTFSKKLSALGITVKELTGDMQLTKQEISQTQMLVVTPEKWDVVTRKSTGDTGLSQLVRLLIIGNISPSPGHGCVLCVFKSKDLNLSTNQHPLSTNSCP